MSQIASLCVVPRISHPLLLVRLNTQYPVVPTVTPVLAIWLVMSSGSLLLLAKERQSSAVVTRSTIWMPVQICIGRPCGCS